MELISALESAFATAVASGKGSQVRPYTFDKEAQTKKHQFVFFVKPEATVSPKLPAILGEVLGIFGKVGVSVGAVRILAVPHFMLTNMHTYTYIYTHTCTCTYTHVCTCTCTHTHTHNMYMHTHTHIHKYTYTHMHARTHIHTHTRRVRSWTPVGS